MTLITEKSGDTFSISLTGLGSVAAYVSLDFTVKASRRDADNDAVLRIRLNASGVGDGLLRLNGVEPSDATAGSIAIDDAGAGDITISLDADESAQILAQGYYYDVQLITAAAVDTLTEDAFMITPDVTRATS